MHHNFNSEPSPAGIRSAQLSMVLYATGNPRRLKSLREGPLLYHQARIMISEVPRPLMGQRQLQQSSSR
jgi:hypothetical protein